MAEAVTTRRTGDAVDASDVGGQLSHKDCSLEAYSSQHSVQVADVVAVTQGDALFHLVLLGIASCVLALALLLRVDGAEKVWVPVIERPLPGLCTYQRLFGVGCPGCGLTRCFISMAHGQASAAWRFNPAGLLLFAVVVAQLPYRTLQLWRIRLGLAELRLGKVSHLLFWACFGALISQWFVRTFVLAS